MTRLVRSEVLKLTSTRTVRWLVVSEVLLVALLLGGALAAGSFPAEVLRTEVGFRSLLEHGGLSALLSLVLGILISSNEFRHQTVADTFLSTPRRLRVVGAKLSAGALIGVIGGVASVSVVAVVGATWYAHLGVSMPVDATLAQGMGGVVGWHVAYALLGVALGFLLRSPAAAIVVALVWVSIAETGIAEILVRAGRWLPATAGRALGGDPEQGLLSQGTAGVVLLAWVGVFATAAIVVTRRRDIA